MRSEIVVIDSRSFWESWVRPSWNRLDQVGLGAVCCMLHVWSQGSNLHLFTGHARSHLADAKGGESMGWTTNRGPLNMSGNLLVDGKIGVI